MSTMTPIDFLILDEHTAATRPENRRFNYGINRENCERKAFDSDYGNA